MKQKLIKIAIILGIVLFVAIAFFLFISFGLKWLSVWLGLGVFCGGSIIFKRKSYKEVNNILTDVRKKNEKINAHDNSAVRDAFNSIGRKDRNN